MNCDQARKRWHERRDGDDTNPDHNPDHSPDMDLDEHLLSCGSCRAYDAEMSLIAGALDELASEPLPPHAATQLVRPAARVYRKLFRAAAMFAMFAVFAGALWWITNSMPQSGTQEKSTKIVEKPESKRAMQQLGSESRHIGLSLRGESAKKYLAVRQSTSVANVHMYWLYPTIHAEEEEK